MTSVALFIIDIESICNHRPLLLACVQFSQNLGCKQ